jgi:hypothetical protein
VTHHVQALGDKLKMECEISMEKQEDKSVMTPERFRYECFLVFVEITRESVKDQAKKVYDNFLKENWPDVYFRKE